jgi:PAS domain S-box-containing protein
MHTLLARQLRRLGIADDAPDATQWAAFRMLVDAAYRESDRDRAMLERALTISSREMRTLYADLEQASQYKLAQQQDRLLEIDAVKAAVLEASPDGVLVIDANRRVVVTNQRFLEIWGIPDHVVRTGDDHQLLAYVLDRLAMPEAFLDRVNALYNDPQACSEDELELANGTKIERFSRPAIDSAGVFRGRLWIFRDVTVRNRQEAQLRDAHAFLDSIIETLPNMVFVKNAADLTFVRFNRAGEQLLGIPRAQLLGRSDRDLFPPEQAAQFVAADLAVLAQREVVTISDEVIKTASGDRRLRTRKIAICDGEDRPTYLLGISEDITEERARSAELYLAKERAETASRAKSDFLLNMSHELRTPLNAILGFARVLARTTRARLSEDELAYVDDIVTAGDHMLRLVNDLLDLRSLESHALELSSLAVEAPIDEAVRIVQRLIHEHGQLLEVDLDAQLPNCWAERRALVQIVVNLMTNATKFTPSGGRISLRARPESSMLLIEVADTGTGISAEDQRRLFVYFEQLGVKHQSTLKGSGVGLALTRALVEKMGGSISLASQVGVGSTFTVRLRQAP